eukprot:12315648-Alexandrium_andersonii.AAC.1
MSASLVGSEMCIRDRHPPGLPQLAPLACRRRQLGGSGGAVAPPARSGGAVSYTHLTLPTICSV